MDKTCIICDLCCELAPSVFAKQLEKGVAYVDRQPATGEELELVLEAIDGCPMGSIGDREEGGGGPVTASTDR